ncbi:MAG: hypothetical protein KF836_07390 [Fimbriimonadaceae bacterium]|nr:hypothetical protein [Fimbriimonadaceae bacterium]
MAFDAWPTEALVGEFLLDCGYSSLPSADIAEVVERAVAELESLVGFFPFLADELVEIELAADGSVALPQPFASIDWVKLDEQEIEWTACPAGIIPIRVVRLAEGISGTVSVAGRAGYGLTVPSDVWYAVRDLAASWVIEMIAQSSTSEIESVKQDSVTVKYRADALSTRMASLLADRARLVFARYWVSGMGA